jgi:alpha-tubulin suppressor-like RCC1 family protein
MTEILTRPPHTAAFAWGYNGSGGLGLGHAARAYQPVPARLPEGTADVQGGGEFTVARTFSGELYAAGGNVYGQLGDGTGETRLAWDRVPLPRGTVITSVQAGTDHVLALTERGEVYA